MRLHPPALAVRLVTPLTQRSFELVQHTRGVLRLVVVLSDVLDPLLLVREHHLADRASGRIPPRPDGLAAASGLNHTSIVHRTGPKHNGVAERKALCAWCRRTRRSWRAVRRLEPDSSEPQKELVYKFIHQIKLAEEQLVAVVLNRRAVLRITTNV